MTETGCPHGENLVAFLDAELGAAEAERLRAHLPACARCAEELRLVEKALALLPSLPRLEPTPALRRRVLTALDERPLLLQRLSSWLRPRLWIPLASAGVAATLVFALLQARQPSADAAQEAELAQRLDLLEDYELFASADQPLELAPEDLEVVSRLNEVMRSP